MIAKLEEEEQEKDILDVYFKAAVIISLLDVIKQMPYYERFLKDWYTKKRKLKYNKEVRVKENMSVILHKKIPLKSKDLDMYLILTANI